MRELLQQARDALNWICEHPEEPSIKVLDAIESIEAALSRSKWVKVADGLPVVPEGQYVARFWIYDKYGHVSKLRLFAHDSKEHIEQACQSVTHYMPRQDDTPAPPEA